MENKRKVSILIPYKTKNSDVFVYLQKREKNRERHPDAFGFFGGGIEDGETPEQALEREIKEELNFEIDEYKYFGYYESGQAFKDVFMFQAPDDFDQKITVLEGEYGKWFNKNEIQEEQKIIESDRKILEDFYKMIEKLS